MVRNIGLENELIRLGVPEAEVHEMSRMEQSIKYEALLRKEIVADADADVEDAGKGKESGDAEMAEKPEEIADAVEPEVQN